MEKADLLLIVDVQKGFINSATQHIPEKVEKLQMKYEHVVATKFINKENSFYRKLIEWNKFSENSVDVDLAFSLKENSLCIEKAIYSCISDEFMLFLNTNQIKSVDIVGIDTDICVTKCAVDLFEIGVVPYVIEDHCASHAGIETHQWAIKTLKRYIGRKQIKNYEM